jgi:hypothetical protein
MLALPAVADLPKSRITAAPAAAGKHSACAGEQDSGESRFDTLHRLADDRDQPPKNAGAHRPFRRNHVQML